MLIPVFLWHFDLESSGFAGDSRQF